MSARAAELLLLGSVNSILHLQHRSVEWMQSLLVWC